MSGALFHVGNRRPPKTGGRRIALALAILVFAGALAPFAILGAVDGWHDGRLGAALSFTVLAVLLLLGAGAALVVGIRTLWERFRP